eukprot:m.150810 g.150810  ORF g.150810 m.150810 type:complete len:392 (+) comp15088_c3_seq1:1344-2519(+)
MMAEAEAATAFVSESQDDSDASEKKFIRVGPEYQATPPALQQSLPTSLPRSRPVWDPRACVLTSDQLDDFVRVAQASTLHKHSIDQILGVLYWNNFDTEATLQDLAQYCPHPEYDTKWSEERILAFETGLRQHGKRFHRVGERLPGISTRQIVLFYYRWKKTRKMDKEISDLMEDKETAAPMVVAAGPSPQPDDEGLRRRRARANGDICANCGDADRVSTVAHGFMCPPCLAHWTTWGVDRENISKRVRRATLSEGPITVDEVTAALATTEDMKQTQKSQLERVETDIAILDETYLRARQAQATKSAHANSALARLSDPRSFRRAQKKRKGRWDPRAAIAAFRKHGRNFEAVARAMDNVKTATEVRFWYNNFRRKFNLDGEEPEAAPPAVI